MLKIFVGFKTSRGCEHGTEASRRDSEGNLPIVIWMESIHLGNVEAY